MSIVLLLVVSYHGARAQNTTNRMPDIYIPNGIFNPQEIDLDFISSRLVSPGGLVTQFALELEVQTIFTSGWLLAGAIWQYAMINTEGELQRTLSGLQFLLSTQALALTVVRSLFDSARSLMSRLIITIFAFGWETTINGIMETADLTVIGDFLFNPGIILLSVGRAVAQVVFFFTAVGPLYYFATEVYPDIRPPSQSSRLFVEDYEYYGDYDDGYQQDSYYPPSYNEWQTAARSLINRQPDEQNFLNKIK